ncbi:MAG: hypothetical protein HYW85_02265 [Deltaproteobacteria bacterium]|nr:hypothetical protein [Deltaproteobacteria bacterium]MBI3017870.1 hypothetical protein [Deltaproteobacteria bacterium]
MQQIILIGVFSFFLGNLAFLEAQVQTWTPEMIQQLNSITKSQPTILRKVNSKDKVLFNTVVHHLKQKNTTAAVTFWKKLHKRLKSNMGKGDITKVFYEALRQSLIETRQDQEYFLRKIASHNQNKKALREHLRNLNNQQREEGKGMSKEELDRKRKEREAQLNTAGDDKQLAQADELQNTNEKLNQTLNMMSQMSKAFAETSESVISNIK